MKTKACALVMGWMLFLAGTMCFAADAAGSKGATAGSDQPTTKAAGTKKDQQELRVWINSIKPAAGPGITTGGETGNEYWHQTVHRENRGSMHE